MQEWMRERVPRFLFNMSFSDSPQFEGRSLKTPLLEKGIHHAAEVIKTNYAQWESTSQNGLFQKMDARIKILFLVFFIILVSLKREISSEVVIGIFIFLFALGSRLNLYHFYKRVLIIGAIFGFSVSLPASLNLVTKGEMIFPLLSLNRPYDFWIYHLPAEIGVTKEGLYGLGMLTLRVINSISLVLLTLYTTSFSEIMKALKMLKIPDGLLMMATLSYKYFFLFAKTVEEMHLAKKSRQMREWGHKEARHWAAGRMVSIFVKTQKKNEEIFRAMLSRGFSNSIKMYGFGKLRGRDWCFGFSLLAMGIFLLRLK